MSDTHATPLHRIYAAMNMADRELAAAWSLVPSATQAWLLHRRAPLSIAASVVTVLAAGPGWLWIVGIYLYAAQPQPRTARVALTPLIAGSVLADWLGSVGGGLGLTSVDLTYLGRSTMFAVVTIIATATAERLLTSHIALHAPSAVGLGHQVVLGMARGRLVTAPRQIATLVIGPPRSRKTTGVVIPNVMAWDGPVLTTSTRREVLEACAAVRQRHGTVWCFEPMEQATELPDGVQRLDWSPLRGCQEWDVALERARALLAGAGNGIEEANHWRARGAQLLAAQLHAAALAPAPMSTVCEWVHSNRLDPATHILSEQADSRARHVIDGIAATPDRERGSIWSAVAGALTAFDSAAVLACADRAQTSTFDPAKWLDGCNSLFIIAPADQATSIAPLVVGLVEEVRMAALRISDRHGPLHHPLLLALDEVANISPLPTLPQIASEGGGRNIILLAVTQDLSQLRERWGNDVATGLLTLAGAKLILPGVGDPDTLDRIEKLCGKQWVEHQSITSGSLLSRNGSWSRHRGLVEEAVHPAAAIRALQMGTGLAIVGGEAPMVLDLATYTTTEPFRTWHRQSTIPGETNHGK